MGQFLMELMALLDLVDCILGFSENKTQHCVLFSTKTNQGRFYFHWAEYLAAVNHVTQAVGFKELRLESKLLNRWLGKEANFIRFSYFTLSTFYIRRKTVTFSKYFLFLLIMRKKILCIFSVVYSEQFFSKLTNI